MIIGLDHVNVTVPAALEDATKHFYSAVLGLRQIPKPEGPRQNIGAWYDLVGAQLHLSIEDGVTNRDSDRHACYAVTNLYEVEADLRAVGAEVIFDEPKQQRFFVRDPGGNLIELSQRV